MVAMGLTARYFKGSALFITLFLQRAQKVVSC